MANLLRRLFIKNYQNTQDPKVRQKHGFLASFVGVFSNLLLFVFKLLIGLLTLSISIITDAINNLTDMASCIVSLVGFKLAGKPADKEHPFGHERIEYIAGMIISFVIIGIAIFLGYESVQKIISNEATEPTLWSFVILGAAILVKLWQGMFYKNIAKIINSVSLKASAQDSINDVISTGCVLLATILMFIFNKLEISVPFSIDGVLGLCLAIFIIVMGVKLIIETANPLIGLTPDHDLVKTVVNDILAYDGVLGVHDLMCHSYGPTKVFMTIHVEVDSQVDVMISHDLIDNIESEISAKHNVILTIHMDPIDTKSEIISVLKVEIGKMLYAFNEKLHFHDLRVVTGNTHTNILFDVVKPYDVKAKDEDLIEYLKTEIKKINPKYNLVVKIDNDYVNEN